MANKQLIILALALGLCAGCQVAAPNAVSNPAAPGAASTPTAVRGSVQRAEPVAPAKLDPVARVEVPPLARASGTAPATAPAQLSDVPAPAGKRRFSGTYRGQLSAVTSTLNYGGYYSGGSAGLVGASSSSHLRFGCDGTYTRTFTSVAGAEGFGASVDKAVEEGTYEVVDTLGGSQLRLKADGVAEQRDFEALPSGNLKIGGSYFWAESGTSESGASNCH